MKKSGKGKGKEKKEENGSSQISLPLLLLLLGILIALGAILFSLLQSPAAPTDLPSKKQPGKEEILDGKSILQLSSIQEKAIEVLVKIFEEVRSGRRGGKLLDQDPKKLKKEKEQEKEEKEEPDLIPALLEERWNQRRVREVKDRYDRVYSSVAQSQNARRSTTYYLPTPQVIPEDLSPLFESLKRAQSQSFLSTEVGIIDFDATKVFEKVDQKYFSNIAQKINVQNVKASKISYFSTRPSRYSQPSLQDLRKFFNITYLPSLEEIYRIFPWLHPEFQDTPIDPEWKQDLASLEEIDYTTPDEFIFACSNPLYYRCEVLNKEYIEVLSRYLISRIQILLDSPDFVEEKVTVAEIGAGTGQLMYFLSKRILELDPYLKDSVAFVASDLKGAGGDLTKSFEVLKKKHTVVLREDEPQIAIVSWMSKDLDWTKDFRASPSLTEYILIGEIDYGAVGLLEETWGIGGNPVFERENFSRFDLDDMSVFQVCRTDSPQVKFHSRTVSFRRNPLK